MLQAIVFDMDGILFDSERLVLDCWVELGRRHGLGDLTAVFMECIGTNKERTKEIVREHLGEEFEYDRFSAESSILFHEMTDEFGPPLKKGVRETLEELKKRGIKLGLASSTKKSTVEAELKATDLYDYFTVIMGGDELKRSKPEPDIYLMTCEQLGADPANCVAVEDSYNGIISAYRAGMMPVMIPDMLPPTGEMEEKSKVILEDMTCLIPWITENFKLR